MNEDEDDERALLADFEIVQLDQGAPGYTMENPFGQTIQVLPRPPHFKAMVVFEWQGAMPDEIVELLERARAAGIVPER